MAPLPKRRHSTRRGGKRKASIKLKVIKGIKCPNCQALILPHRICPQCGYYNKEKRIEPKMPKSKTKSKS